MAMQAGMGFSKIIILVGAGYTGTLLLNNGKLSDLLGDIQSLVKGYENKGEDGESDAIATQVRRLAMEVRQLASARQITILNGGSGGKMTSLVVPVAAVGALGYGYMWWKGLSFSDLMYVTKQSMSNAVSNLTKHLEHVSDVLAETKRHLTQRIENLDGKVDEQIEISKLIKNEVSDVRADLSDMGYDLDTIHAMVSGLDGKILTLERKQDLANKGILYLVNFVDGKRTSSPELLQVQEQLKLSGKAQGFLTASEESSPKGLKELTEALLSENSTGFKNNGNVEDLADARRRLVRTSTTKY
ncbi:uncharacterized protein LOC108200064 [Daucus carota subsp. sativus]|uniref:uncharacterized protein LOC108200064 n=1 Tax=Daucus carota subsp. sativus TaxID=79200 RepID=UPI0007EFCDAF|nr:PREDICTED: uncharacterized protein LOC108200064 [Daucus carota subsp. sativus]